MKIYKWVNDIRKDYKMSIKEFAKKVGISETEVELLESGLYDPDEETINKIKKAFHITNINIQKNISTKDYFKSKNIKVPKSFIDDPIDHEYQSFKFGKYEDPYDEFDFDEWVEEEFMNDLFNDNCKVDDFEFNDNVLLSYTGFSDLLEIPSKYKRENKEIIVLEIDRYLFKSFNSDVVKKVIIPSSINKISYDVFHYCSNLEYIDVSTDNKYYKSVNGVLYEKKTDRLVFYPPKNRIEELKITNEIIKSYDNIPVFNSENIRKIYLSEQVIDIEFGYLPSLEEIILDPKNKSFKLVDGVLFDYSFSKLIKYPSNRKNELYKVPLIDEINNYAFSGCKFLNTVFIPNTVINIKEKAFINNPDLTICMSIFKNYDYFKSNKWIKKDPFYRNYNLISWGYSTAKHEVFFIEDDKIIGREAIYSLDKISFPHYEKKGYILEEWEKIEKNFDNCALIDYIVFRAKIKVDNKFVHNQRGIYLNMNSVVGVEEKIFEIDIPCKNKYSDLEFDVLNIEVDAFLSDQIEIINIPDSVTSIALGAFKNCRFLEKINVDEDNLFYSSKSGVLYNKEMDELICVPSNYDSETIIIDNNIRKINSFAFYNVKTLKQIYIPKNVLFIEDYAFMISNVTIYCEAEEQPSGWSSMMFSPYSSVTIVWGKH